MLRQKLPALVLCLMVSACAFHATPEDAQMANALCTQGKTLLEAGKNTEARDVYASATYRDDENPRAWNGLGAADDLLGKHADAQDAYQHAVDISPNDLVMINNLAHIYIETGNDDKAVALLQPHATDPAAPLALRQNLAIAQQAAQTKQTAISDVYADLGSYPTEGMAQGHIKEIKTLLGSDADGLTFAVEPDVKIIGGIPVFTIKATGRSPQSICDDLNPKAFPCVPQGK